MKTFNLYWDEEVGYRATIEAESLEEAKEKFSSGEVFDSAKETGKMTFIEGSLEIEEEN